jgi:AraC family L-rhamnose operon regulatory protein RhaS
MLLYRSKAAAGKCSFVYARRWAVELKRLTITRAPNLLDRIVDRRKYEFVQISTLKENEQNFMQRTVPIYRSHEETYVADACISLIEAARRRDIRLHARARGHYPGERLPENALQGLKTVGFWDAEHAQSWGLPWHRNEGLELTFLERGSLGFAVEDRQWQLEPGHLTLTRPWQRHRVGNPNTAPGRLHWLIVDVGVRRPNQKWQWPPWVVLSAPDLEDLSNILRHCERPVWKAGSQIRRCFQAIAQSVQSGEPNSHVSSLTVRVNELLLLVLELLRKQNGEFDLSLSTTLRTVELFLADLMHHPDNLANDWNVDQMARACGLGATQFTEYVRRLTNMTPSQYLTHCRFQQAIRLLEFESGMNITDVAIACGFSSSQYFATVFRRCYDCSPKQYRKRYSRADAAGECRS